MVNVEIEYCAKCGYGPRYEELSNLIREALPAPSDVQVIGRDGRTASFEVEIDGELIYSKLERGTFPDFKEVVEVIASVVNEGGEPRQVQESQPFCTIS